MQASALLESSAEVDDLDGDEETPCHVAARKKNAAMVEMLLKNGASTRVKNLDGDTVVHIAAARCLILRLVSVLLF